MTIFWGKSRPFSLSNCRLKKCVNTSFFHQCSMISVPYFEKGARSSVTLRPLVDRPSWQTHRTPNLARTTGALFVVWFTNHTALDDQFLINAVFQTDRKRRNNSYFLPKKYVLGEKFALIPNIVLALVIQPGKSLFRWIFWTANENSSLNGFRLSCHR